MYSYIKGLIVEINHDHIVVENNGIGYLVYVSSPYGFTLNQEKTVYIYQQIKEDAHLLFGFESRELKDLFTKLILVKGIGCKTAIGMLAVGQPQQIIEAIESNNLTYLKKIPGIGPKAAGQIVLDLKGKFKNIEITMTSSESQEIEDAREVLIALGYKVSEVDKVIKEISTITLDTNGYVKKALSMLVK